MRRAAPLPNSVRVSAASFTSDISITPRRNGTDVVTRPRTACYEERVDNGPPYTRVRPPSPSNFASLLGQGGRTQKDLPLPHRVRPQNPHCSSKRLVTEPSSKTSRTALAMVGAIDNTVILSR